MNQQYDRDTTMLFFFQFQEKAKVREEAIECTGGS
jgi:hypothetical protein